MTAKGPRRTTPLIWNVAGLLGDEAGCHRDYEVDGVTIDLGEDLRLAEPIEGRVRLARTNRGLLVDADLTTSLQAECGRCLRDDRGPDRGRDPGRGPAGDRSPHRPRRSPPEPGEEELLRLTDHHELDLEPPIREAILLAEPIAPLCREDCPGLCLVCGERLDEGTHDHPSDDIDPAARGAQGLQGRRRLTLEHSRRRTSRYTPRSACDSARSRRAPTTRPPDH